MPELWIVAAGGLGLVVIALAIVVWAGLVLALGALVGVIEAQAPPAGAPDGGREGVGQGE